MFAGGDVSGEARLEARDFLEEKRKQKDGTVKPWDGFDLGHEVTYQILYRVLFEWDEEKDMAGDQPLFESIDLLRKCVVPEEAKRLMDAYDAYVKEEHPADIDPVTFRRRAPAPEGGSEGVASPQPG